MPTIQLETFIDAPSTVCFEAGRSIDLHLNSMRHTNEKAVAGRTSGRIELYETVTWEAQHFLIPWRMTVQITEMDFPNSFTDKMIKGPFKRMKHIHRFIIQGSATLMIDEFVYASPFGLLGKFIDAIVLERYMTDLLLKRNQVIKQEAEAIAREKNKWSILTALIGQKVISAELGSSIVAAINTNPVDRLSIMENASLYIGFETHHLNIQNWFTLAPAAISIDRIPGLTVLAVQETSQEAIIEFTGGARLRINLCDEAYTDPEAMSLSGPKGLIKIWS